MFAALALLIVTGEIQPWHVYVTAIGMAAVRARFQQPARAAIISDVVPTKNLTNAIGLNSIIFNVAPQHRARACRRLDRFLGTGGAYGMQALFYLLATFCDVALAPCEPRVGRRSWGSRRRIVPAKASSKVGSSVWRNETVRHGTPDHDVRARSSSCHSPRCCRFLPAIFLNVGATGQGLL